MPYELLKIFVGFILLIHFAVAMNSKYLWYSDMDFRPFPFFSWSLFSKVPEETEVLQTIRIVSVEGKRLIPPVYFADANKYIQVNAHSPREWYNLFQDLVNKERKSPKEDATLIRSEIEKYFYSKQIEYESVEIRFRSIDFYKSRTVLEETSYGIYKTY